MLTINATDLHFQTLNEAIKSADDTHIQVTNLLGHRYIGSGLERDRTLELYGVPGNALGAYLSHCEIIVHGNAQDATGDTMDSGRIVIHGNSGDTTGYAMRGGEIYVRDNAGYRVGIHMKAYEKKRPVIVIGGRAGDFLGEYQAGGLLIVLGIGVEGVPVGEYCGTGMHGGAIYIRGDEPPKHLSAQVVASRCDKRDLAEIRPYVEEYCLLFGVKPEELLASNFYKLLPNSKNPYRQLYVHN